MDPQAAASVTPSASSDGRYVAFSSKRHSPGSIGDSPLVFGSLIDAATPGKEILHPVAVTIFGGLVSATLLDALITPILFLRFGKRPLERLRALQEGAEGTSNAKASQAF